MNLTGDPRGAAELQRKPEQRNVVSGQLNQSNDVPIQQPSNATTAAPQVYDPRPVVSPKSQDVPLLPPWLDILLRLMPVVSSSATAAVAWLVLKHYRAQRKDRWIEQFSAIHDHFWKDENMKQVRRWLACRDSYDTELGPVLRRRQQTENATSENYEVLEKLDSFFNLMTRLTRTIPELPEQQKLLTSTFFTYWMKEATDGNVRPELRWYVQTFYQDLTVAIDGQFGVRSVEMPSRTAERMPAD